VVGTAAVIEGAPTEAERATGARYRPYLDGLRAVAVYLVVLFHAGNGRFTGGYVGVDIFFVLSGYLVTELLLRDLLGIGGIRFARFYSRRFRRLLPAAFVALIVTGFVYVAIASPLEVANAVGSFKAAFLYVTNWYFIHESAGYFGADVAGNPVLQFWSLAIEEQFYLVWPLALGGLAWCTRRLSPSRRHVVIPAIIAAGALMSAGWALSIRDTDPNRAYYGTDARAYQLLAGALLALTPVIIRSARRYERAARVLAGACIAGLIVLATSWIHLDAIERGIAVTLVTVAFLVAVESGGDGLVARALSHPTVVYLGRISYGTYLWHWIVVIVAARSFDLGTTTTVIVLLVSTALAPLSYQLLEQPIRLSKLLDRHRRAVIVAGLAISVVAALVIVPKVVDASDAEPVVAQGNTAGFTRTPALDWSAATENIAPFTNCYQRPVEECTVVQGTSGPHLLLVGDSHAGMLIPALTEIARRNDATLSLAVKGGCPWQEALYATPVTVNGTTLRTEDCKNEKNDFYNRVLPELKPDLIFTMNVDHENADVLPYLGPDGKYAPSGSPRSVRWLRETTTDSLAKLRATGGKVVLVEPTPVAPFDPLDCLSESTYVEECRYVANKEPVSLETDYRELDRQYDDVWSVDMDRMVCPYLPICDPIVDGEIVKWDASHLTTAFVEAIAPRLDDYVRESGGYAD
jgi:peptidoglycan/LPS O-acetylase OafA/YrhL